jgi:hypothetical protein
MTHTMVGINGTTTGLVYEVVTENRQHGQVGYITFNKDQQCLYIFMKLKNSNEAITILICSINMSDNYLETQILYSDQKLLRC